jgi:signal transduction histidine kinase
MRRSRWQTVEYVGLLAGSLVLALVASWMYGGQIDNDAYDWNFRRYHPADWAPQTVLLGIDEESYLILGGVARRRAAIAEGLELVAKARPKAVAIDLILADDPDNAGNGKLAAAIRQTPNVVLSSQLLKGGWEEPLPIFRRAAAGIGHVYADPDPVSRKIMLHKAAGHDRRWALALEAYRAGLGKPIVETQYDVEIGDVVIPSPDRVLRIRYRMPEHPVPQVSLARLLADPTIARQFTGKTVFVGDVAASAGDRLMTPYSYVQMPGVEIHANIFETIANRLFLVTAPMWATVVFCLALVTVAGAAFSFRPGWPAYAISAIILAIAFVTSYVCFTRGVVLSFTAPVFSAGLSVAAAASYQYFVVRKRMFTAEGDKSRYQQAMHFVTHEMRTPLTAIQGSSELIGRYAMPEEKRKQMADLINSESKRLGKMIEIFLSVERLSAGQLELKKEQFSGTDLMSACVERVRPLAERKQIGIRVEPGQDAPLVGDRELMEYAFYNLLTNAVKYSPASTEVVVSHQRNGDRVRFSVRDQGMGMDQKEVRKIFQKFYRTKKAEESGEAGTGIGLSIVEQIVTQHGGAIEVESSPGRGSCFTLVLPTQKVNSMVESK